MSVPMKVADASATLAVAAAGATWIDELNGWLQLIATTVALVAAIFAIMVHRKNLKK